MKSCHTGYRKTAGWTMPIGGMIASGALPIVAAKSNVRNDAESVDAFFAATCAAGCAPAGPACQLHCHRRHTRCSPASLRPPTRISPFLALEPTPRLTSNGASTAGPAVKDFGSTPYAPICDGCKPGTGDAFCAGGALSYPEPTYDAYYDYPGAVQCLMDNRAGGNVVAFLKHNSKVPYAAGGSGAASPLMDLPSEVRPARLTCPPPPAAATARRRTPAAACPPPSKTTTTRRTHPLPPP